jgi:hypothetical protein
MIAVWFQAIASGGTGGHRSRRWTRASQPYASISASCAVGRTPTMERSGFDRLVDIAESRVEGDDPSDALNEQLKLRGVIQASRHGAPALLSSPARAAGAGRLRALADRRSGHGGLSPTAMLTVHLAGAVISGALVARATSPVML